MKTKFYYFYLPLLALSFISCGGKETKAENEDETKKELVNENILNPLTADFSKVIGFKELSQSMKVYYETEIQLIVYPITYLEKEKFTDNLACATSMDSDERSVYLKFKILPTGEFKSKTAYLIKAKIYRLGFNNSLELKDVELVGEAKDKKTVAFDPQTISADKIYSAVDILKNMQAWKGKQVTVTGDYMGTTVSKSVDGKTIYETRVDLGEIGNYDYVVGCAFDQDPSASLPARKKGVKIQGILDAELHFDRPYLTKCALK